MRVISGSAKRLLLKTLKGNDVRPTSDKIKETLFNIIEPEIYGASFLDAFAGSGGIGIEALSRGAKQATFIEKNRQAHQCIRENLQHTKLTDKAELICGDALYILKSGRINQKYDLIYLDPPYYEGLYIRVLEIIKEKRLLAEGGSVIIECDSRHIDDFENISGYTAYRIKDYKNTAHIFLKGV